MSLNEMVNTLHVNRNAAFARIVPEVHSEIALCDILDQGNPHYSYIMDKFDCYDQQLVCGAAFTAELGDIWKHLKVKEEVPYWRSKAN